MKNAIALLLVVLTVVAKGQTTFPLYVPTNPDSIKHVVNVNGAPRTVLNIDLIKKKLNITDTTNKWLPRTTVIPAAVDTTPLHNQIVSNTTAISTKLNISDTANIRLRPVAGTNMTITGTYPNLTFSSTASGGGSQTLQQVLTQGSTLTQANTVTTNTYLRLSGNHTRIDSAVIGRGAPKLNGVLTLRDTNINGGNIIVIPTFQGDTVTGNRPYANFTHQLDQHFVNPDGQRDAAYSIGYNLGRQNPNEASFYTTLESHYQFNGAQFEWYLESVAKNGNFNRYMAINAKKDDGTATEMHDMDGVEYRSTTGLGHTSYFSTGASGITDITGTAARLIVTNNTANPTAGAFKIFPNSDGTLQLINSGRGATTFSNLANYGFNISDSNGVVFQTSRNGGTLINAGGLDLATTGTTFPLTIRTGGSADNTIKIQATGGANGSNYWQIGTGNNSAIVYFDSRGGIAPFRFFVNSGGTDAMDIFSDGKIGIGTSNTSDATNKLQVSGSVKATQFRLSALNTAPTSATDTGTLGEVRITSGFIYVCTATNTWVRSALATW